MLTLRPNSVLDHQDSAAVPLQLFPATLTHTRRRRPTAQRLITDLRRKENAVQALAPLTREVEIFGFSKGQFSLIDLIRAALAHTGPAFLTVSTWTAAHTDLTQVLEFLDAGSLTGTRWLVDYSLQRRAPELANKIRLLFGHDAVRVAKNHAKFSMLRNSTWDLLLRTSMNLNTNPRFEDFTIAHDPELCDFLQGVLEHIWKRQPQEMALENAYTLVKNFREDL